MTPIIKDGELLSRAYSEWVRSQSCAFCGKAPRSEQHHYPTRGASGATNDLRSAPACRNCHLRCGGQVVTVAGKRMQPYTAIDQAAVVASTFSAFWARAPWHVVLAVLEHIKEWRASRVFIEVDA